MNMGMKHVKEVLSSEIVIGSDSSADKTLVYSPFKNKFIVYQRGGYLASSPNAEDLLKFYNELD